jgi:hypothetical protein
MTNEEIAEYWREQFAPGPLYERFIRYRKLAEAARDRGAGERHLAYQKHADEVYAFLAGEMHKPNMALNISGRALREIISRQGNIALARTMAAGRVVTATWRLGWRVAAPTSGEARLFPCGPLLLAQGWLKRGG